MASSTTAVLDLFPYGVSPKLKGESFFFEELSVSKVETSDIGEVCSLSKGLLKRVSSYA